MRRLLTLGVILLLAGCADRSVTGVSDEAALLESPDFGVTNPASHVVVMSQNVYFGTPVEPILAATDPDTVPFLVAEAWAILQYTNPQRRMAALADEIARERPHLVGLQEIALFRTQTPSDFVTGTFWPNATDVAYDYVELLLDELAARGASYTVAATVWDTDVEIPKVDSVVVVGGVPVPYFTDVRLTDRDVVLVRGDVPTANPGSGNFVTQLPAPAGINVLRGWAAVDAKVFGTWYRFVCTHLESDWWQYRNGQAYELLQVLAPETKPLIVVGDFNTGPGRPLQPGEDPTAYQMMLAGGYTDLWLERPGRYEDGFTCCHADNMSHPEPTLDQRIDLVWARNIASLGPPSGNTIVQSWLVGATAKERVRYGLWPSDHAGAVMRLVLPSPQIKVVSGKK